MNSLTLYPLIIVSGLLQAFGPPMNAQFRLGLVNPWLASLISFLLIVALLTIVYAMFPTPVPTAGELQKMPWWAALGGISGVFAVVAGLMFVDKVGAGPFAAMTIGANLAMSVAIDHFGMFRVPLHTASPLRLLGVVVMFAGIFLISKF